MATPEQFIERLMVHFAKRHPDEHAEAVWFADMVKALKGYDPQVLDLAADMLLDERTEVRFPLPAEIRQYCTRACEKLFPERTPTNSDPYVNVPRPTPEQRARVQALVDAAKASMAVDFKPERRPSREHTSRDAFEALQDYSPNANLHMTKAGLSERSKAMSGDREDAA